MIEHPTESGCSSLTSTAFGATTGGITTSDSSSTAVGNGPVARGEAGSRAADVVELHVAVGVLVLVAFTPFAGAFDFFFF
jgi:hypothetical protein